MALDKLRIMIVSDFLHFQKHLRWNFCLSIREFIIIIRKQFSIGTLNQLQLFWRSILFMFAPSKSTGHEKHNIYIHEIQYDVCVRNREHSKWCKDVLHQYQNEPLDCWHQHHNRFNWLFSHFKKQINQKPTFWRHILDYSWTPKLCYEHRARWDVLRPTSLRSVCRLFWHFVCLLIFLKSFRAGVDQNTQRSRQIFLFNPYQYIPFWFRSNKIDDSWQLCKTNTHTHTHNECWQGLRYGACEKNDAIGGMARSVIGRRHRQTKVNCVHSRASIVCPVASFTE